MVFAIFPGAGAGVGVCVFLFLESEFKIIHWLWFRQCSWTTKI